MPEIEPVDAAEEKIQRVGEILSILLDLSLDQLNAVAQTAQVMRDQNPQTETE